jgi:hypothetical protein
VPTRCKTPYYHMTSITFQAGLSIKKRRRCITCQAQNIETSNKQIKWQELTGELNCRCRRRRASLGHRLWIFPYQATSKHGWYIIHSSNSNKKVNCGFVERSSVLLLLLVLMLDVMINGNTKTSCLLKLLTLIFPLVSSFVVFSLLRSKDLLQVGWRALTCELRTEQIRRQWWWRRRQQVRKRQLNMVMMTITSLCFFFWTSLKTEQITLQFSSVQFTTIQYSTVK